MKALILADRLGRELMPLTQHVPPALLPIAGREVLVRTIEALVTLGLRELIVVISSTGKQQSARVLGDGQRWGCRFRYVLDSGEVLPSVLWSRLQLDLDEGILLLRGDVLRSPSLVQHAQQAVSNRFLLPKSNEMRAGVLCLRTVPDPAWLDTFHWSATQTMPVNLAQQALADANENTLSDVVAFHRASADVLAERFSGLYPSGQQAALGLVTGARVQVSPRSLRQGRALVGEGSRIHPEAELHGEVLIGDHVIIDRAAIIRDSVILSHTYVGELLEIRNSVVMGNHLLRVDTGARLTLSDVFLLGNLEAQAQSEGLSRLDQGIALALVLCSLPLNGLALIWVLALRRQPLMQAVRCIGNRTQRPDGGEFTLWQWNFALPVLRRLPALMAVVRGDLRLFGVEPLTRARHEGRTEEWQRVRDQAPVGLLGPTQLLLDAQAPVEERLLSDAFYVRERGLKRNVRLMMEWARLRLRGVWT